MRSNAAAMAGGRALTTPRRGHDVRQATRDRAMQDLLHRSEYLAGIVAQAHEVEAAPAGHLHGGENVAATLRASKIPHAVDAATSLLRAAPQAWEGAHATPQLLTGPAHRVRRNFASVKQSAAEAEEHHTARIVGTLDPSAAHGRGHHAHRLEGTSNWEDTCQGMDRLLGTLPYSHAESAGTALGQKLRGPLEMLKVKPFAGPGGSDSLWNDHHHAKQMEWQRHAGSQCTVEWLGEEGAINTATPGLRFAQHFWRLKHLAEASQPVSIGPSRFLRVDGGGDSDTHKCTLMEGGLTVVRKEGLDPFHSHALLTAAEPLQVFPDGHYFEVRLKSLFRSIGPPARPRQGGRRTEGLVIGVTTHAPHEVDSTAQRAGHVAPGAWCVSTSGVFYSGGDPGGRQTRDANRQGANRGLVASQRTGWRQPARASGPEHNHMRQKEMLQCTWPPPGRASTAEAAAGAATDPVSAQGGGAAAAALTEEPAERAATAPSARDLTASEVDAIRERTRDMLTKSCADGSLYAAIQQEQRGAEEAAAPPTPAAATGASEVASAPCGGRPTRLAWTVLMQEGDKIGLLVTPFGGVTITVNGESRLLIPDAGVPNDLHLYPIVEVYNHVRSVQLVKQAVPPTTPIA